MSEGLSSFSAHVMLQALAASKDFQVPEAQKHENHTVPVPAETQHKPALPWGRARRRAEEKLILPWDYLTSSAKTGRKMIIVAVLLANSVNKAMTIVMRMTATGGGTPSKGCRRPPIQTDKPDSCRRREQTSWRAELLRPCR